MSATPPVLKRTIGGRTFEVGAIESLVEVFELEPMVAPAAGRLFGLVVAVLKAHEEKSGVDVELEDSFEDNVKRAIAVDPGFFFGEVGNILAAIKPRDMGIIVRKLLATAKCDGQPVWMSGDEPFNSIFRGKTKDRYQVLLMALQVNYPDFLPDAAGESGGPLPAASPSAGSNTSPGPGPSTVSSPPAGSPSPTSTPVA